MTNLNFVFLTEEGMWYVAKDRDPKDILKEVEDGFIVLRNFSLKEIEVQPYIKTHFCIIANFQKKLLFKNLPYFSAPEGWKTVMSLPELWSGEVVKGEMDILMQILVKVLQKVKPIFKKEVVKELSKYDLEVTARDADEVNFAQESDIIVFGSTENASIIIELQSCVQNDKVVRELFGKNDGRAEFKRMESK